MRATPGITWLPLSLGFLFLCICSATDPPQATDASTKTTSTPTAAGGKSTQGLATSPAAATAATTAATTTAPTTTTTTPAGPAAPTSGRTTIITQMSKQPTAAATTATTVQLPQNQVPTTINTGSNTAPATTAGRTTVTTGKSTNPPGPPNGLTTQAATTQVVKDLTTTSETTKKDVPGTTKTTTQTLTDVKSTTSTLNGGPNTGVRTSSAAATAAAAGPLPSGTIVGSVEPTIVLGSTPTSKCPQCHQSTEKTSPTSTTRSPGGAQSPSTPTSTTSTTSTTISSAQQRVFNYSLHELSEVQTADQKNLAYVCKRLLADWESGRCQLTWHLQNGSVKLDSVKIDGEVKTTLANQYLEETTKKPTDNKTLIAILASCGALLIMIVILAVCASHHRKPYSENQQHLTEELHTVENGYHDNPTLEVMEVQPEMQEKKVALNGEFNDSWIVPFDNLMKEDVPDEEDTHL